MTFAALTLAFFGWWVVWCLRPVLVPLLDSFWRRLFRDIEL